jgi:serine/threonine-protein kinase
LLEEIGRGGMGVIFKARDVDLQRVVAVKILSERYSPNSAAALRFIDEGRITGQLQHPGIPAVHQAGQLPDGRPFLAMKLIRGRTLDDHLKDLWSEHPSVGDAGVMTDRTGLPTADRGRFVAIFEQICQAVSYAHAHQVIHRDLKPSNVMVGSFNEVQVMDWGLAKLLSGASEEPTENRAEAELERTEIRTTRDSRSYTEAGSLLGTPAYMPPEQAAGSIERIDERADVFGLGAILCAVLTGRPPYTGDDGETVRLKAIQGKTAEAFTRLEACGAEPGLIALCKRCLATDPKERPRNAGEVARDVEELRSAAEDRAKRAELDRAAANVRIGEERKRRRTQLVLAGVVLAAAGGAAVAGLWYERQRAASDADRAARRARTASGVTAALEDARIRLDEGWNLTNDPSRMRVSTAHAEDAVRRAEGLVETGEPDDATRAEVSAARSAVNDLSRHTRLLTDAERIMREHAQGFTAGPRITAQRAGSARKIAAALRDFGLDPTAMSAPEAGQLVAGSRIRDQLLGYLREWEWMGDTLPERPQVRAVIREAQLAAGGPLARWQEAVDRKDPKALRAVSVSPDVLTLSPDLINALGRDLGAMGLGGQTSINLLRRTVDRYPDSAWSHYDLANACMRVNPPLRNEALRHASVAAGLVPDSAFFQYRLAAAFEAVRAPSEAERCYRKTVVLDPRYVNAHFALARLLQARMDLVGAEAALRAAVSAQPKYDYAHFQLGKLLAVRKNNSEAVAELRRAVDLFEPMPSYNRIYNDLPFELMKLGQTADALRFLKRLMELRPDWAANPEYPVFHNTACCLVLLSTDVKSSPELKSRLRREAHAWLRADLDATRGQFLGDRTRRRQWAFERMESKLNDADLKSVRDREALDALPVDERVVWVKLWTEIRALRDATAPPEVAPPPRRASRREASPVLRLCAYGQGSS